MRVMPSGEGVDESADSVLSASGSSEVVGKDDEGTGSEMDSTVSSVSGKSWANGGIDVGTDESSVPSATLSHIFLT